MPVKKKPAKKKTKAHTPIHPGKVLEKFLTQHDLTAYRLAKEIKIDASLLGKIIKGDRPISPLVSLALGKFFRVDEAYWVTLQVQYDLGVTKLEKDVLIHSIRTIGEMNV
ncbi:MAG: HigA family addiction module antidote protein [Leptospiraceae bacterium]|nr:HigA family addiction module antidote protein [Leptospiraceae bacterium]